MSAKQENSTTFLVTEEHPDGWRLEDILMTIQSDIMRRTQKIVGDNRPEARTVLNNNLEILRCLSQSIEYAEDSTRVLNKSFGPHVSGKPRIGVV